MFHVPEKYRLKAGSILATHSGYKNNGAFTIPYRTNFNKPAIKLSVIASDGEGWEHVSVSLPDRCPTWAEMCWIKDMFWDDTDCVIQYHPPRSEYVNNHPYCLHLWRPIGVELPMPQSILVGTK